MQLDESTSPTTGAIGSIELEHTVSTLILAYGILHCLIFLHRRFGKLESKLKCISNIAFVEHIITEGTIDEHVMKALEMKDNTQSALIDAVKAEVRADGK